MEIKLWRFHCGQAALVMVFGLGMMGVLAALAFSSFGGLNLGRSKNLTDSTKAYYAAQSGIEELMVRLRSHHNFDNQWSMSGELDNGSVFYATISGDLDRKVATATGIFAQFTRRLEVEVASSSSKASFLFAVQSGEGGFELEKGTQIRGFSGQPGNVYSNGDLLGESISSGTTGSKVMGDAWVVGKISGLSGDTSGGVFISGDAAASKLRRCRVGGDVAAPVAPTDCLYGGEYQVAPGPVGIPMEAIDIAFWKQQAAQSSTWVGDCVIDSHGGVTDCSGDAKQLGPVKIEGNLIINSNTSLTLTGSIWVEGDLEINSNVDIDVEESLGAEGVVVVIDYPGDRLGRGKIVTESNVTFGQTTSGGPAVFVSTNTDDNCAASPAIEVSSNTATVVFSAPDGCINFGSNSFVRGVLAKKVHLSNNSIIEYDPRLSLVILRTGLGGWAVSGLRELGDSVR